VTARADPLLEGGSQQILSSQQLATQLIALRFLILEAGFAGQIPHVKYLALSTPGNGRHVAECNSSLARVPNRHGRITLLSMAGHDAFPNPLFFWEVMALGLFLLFHRTTGFGGLFFEEAPYALQQSNPSS